MAFEPVPLGMLLPLLLLALFLLVAAVIAGQAGEKGVRLELAVNGDLPAVTVDADRRGVDEAPHAMAGRGLEQALAAEDVHLAVVSVGVPGRTVDGGHVQHGVAARHQPVDGRGVGQVAFDDRGGARPEALGKGLRAHQHGDVVAPAPKCREQASAGVSGGARQCHSQGEKSNGSAASAVSRSNQCL